MPLPTRLEHIGIAVADATRTASVLEKVLDLGVYKIEEVASERVRTHFLNAGSAKLELLEATAPDSAIAVYLEKHREGLHHLAFEVPDIESAWQRAVDAGLEPLGPGPKTGADGKSIFFLHPRSTGGILIEFCAQQPITLAPRFVEHAGQDLPTYATGKPGAPAVLLLHDAGETVHSGLAALMHTLAPDWCTLAVDLQDIGDGRATRLTLEAIARQAFAVLDAYDVPAAAVVGFGLGASAALQLAAAAPHRVRAAVAHAPHPMPPGAQAPEIPILIAGHDADPAFTPADAVRLLERYPDVRLSISPGNGKGRPSLGEETVRWLAGHAR
ncbi:MAG: methylmalonyl-CoA epimerase [Rhodothermales bacterium]